MKYSDIFKDDPLLEELKGDLPLSLENKIKLFETRMQYCDRSAYISVMELYKGKFLERVFAFRRNRKSRKYRFQECKEVMRILEGSDQVLVRDMLVSRIGGYRVIWERKRYSYYWIVEPDGIWEVERRKRWTFSNWIHAYCFDDLVAMDPTLKYCGLNHLRFWPDRVTDFITFYRIWPGIEMLCKHGLAHLASDRRFLKRIEADQAFRNYVLSNRLSISCNEYNYVYINAAYKLGLTISEYERLEDLIKTKHETIIAAIVKKKTKVLEYLTRLGITSNNGHVRNTRSDYRDYLLAAVNYVDISRDKHLFPDDLMAAHDKYVAMADAGRIKTRGKMTPEEIEKIAAVVERYLDYEYENEELMVVLAKSKEEFLKEGFKLDHCVREVERQYGYYNRMLAQKALILFIRHVSAPGRPYYTVEMEPSSKTVLQCRGNHNCAPGPDVEKFVAEWLEYLKLPKKRRQKIHQRRFASEQITQSQYCGEENRTQFAAMAAVPLS